jgi:hypothetical protein
MAKLIYSAITSLDGYVADRDGTFDWAAPDEQVHAFVNDLERPIGCYLYGRRMYQTMLYWESASTGPDRPAVERDFAQLWQAARRSSIPALWRRCPAPGPGSNLASIPMRSDDSKMLRSRISRSAVRSWQRRRSGPVWSTSTGCSSPR